MVHPMTDTTHPFFYREVGVEEIDAVRPLWEQLNAHHLLLSRHFGDEMGQRTFEPRKQQLLAKAGTGKLKIDLAGPTTTGSFIAYCISSLCAGGNGEIDSIFVEEHFRGRGIGAGLVRRALEWLDDLGATSKTVVVAYPNEEAVAFYSRFGFLPCNLSLRQRQASSAS